MCRNVLSVEVVGLFKPEKPEYSLCYLTLLSTCPVETESAINLTSAPDRTEESSRDGSLGSPGQSGVLGVISNPVLSTTVLSTLLIRLYFHYQTSLLLPFKPLLLFQALVCFFLSFLLTVPSPGSER